MYRALQQEFQSDKVAKLKSDQIDLPKGAVLKPRRRKTKKKLFSKRRKREAGQKKKNLKKKPAVAAETATDRS